MSENIAVMTNKGGVGKTTTAWVLGLGLQRRGARVLLIDMDAQGNLSYTMDAATTESAPTVADVLYDRKSVREAIVHTAQGDLLCSSKALAGADRVLESTGKEYRLKEALEELSGDYDYIVMDTPPALGILTVNALTACNSVIVPAQADVYSLQGIGQLYQTLDAVKRYCNPSIVVRGVLLTRYNARTVLSRDVSAQLSESAQTLDTQLLHAKIRECTAIKEAQACKQSIFDYAPKSNAVIDYNALLDELDF